jgi:hypothetical protein
MQRSLPRLHQAWNAAASAPLVLAYHAIVCMGSLTVCVRSHTFSNTSFVCAEMGFGSYFCCLYRLLKVVQIACYKLVVASPVQQAQTWKWGLQHGCFRCQGWTGSSRSGHDIPFNEHVLSCGRQVHLQPPKPSTLNHLLLVQLSLVWPVGKPDKKFENAIFAARFHFRMLLYLEGHCMVWIPIMQMPFSCMHIPCFKRLKLKQNVLGKQGLAWV